MQDTISVSSIVESVGSDAKSIEPTAAGIRSWCQSYIANLLGLQPSKVSPEIEFDRLGLDSATAVAMCLDLEEQLGIEIPPALLFEYTTIGQLAGYVADAARRAQGASA